MVASVTCASENWGLSLTSCSSSARAWTRAQRAFEVAEGFLVLLILPKKGAQIQVRGEIVRIAREFLAEGVYRGWSVARGHQRRAIVGVDVRQFGIEFHGPLQ